MHNVRALIRDYRALAMLLLAMAMLVKVLVPTGYMAGDGQRLLSVQICLDGINHKTIQIALPSEDTPSGHQPDTSGKADLPCAYTILSMGMTGGVDAPLLALAIAFILALGFAPAHPVLKDRSHHIRPPLRGPPALS